jgi:hypothetical protein
MKSTPVMIVVTLVLAVIVLMLVLPARAGERGDDPPVGEASAPAPVDAAAPSADEGGQVILHIGETIGGEEPIPPSLTAQQIHARLVESDPGAGWQLPFAPVADRSGWQTVEAGLATMRVPPDWTVSNRIGAPGDEDQTVGVSPPAQDLYIELRQIRNADNNYRQTAADHALSEYARSPDRLKEGVILGYQPLFVGGAAGHVEVMNQFGKEVDDDGVRTFRLILWRGRWEQATEIHRAEFTATFAQDRYDELAPQVRAILDTVQVRGSEKPQ